MSSIQERLQIKREPLDKWSIREQLCLASAVAKCGDQNWMSVSRALKPFADPNRPSDWFHQKNCAAQYGSLLENVETPKRKKRISGSGAEPTIEVPIDTILRKLSKERITQLENCLSEEKQEYLKLQEDMALLQNGNVSEELLDKWCKEIDDEEKQKEEETIAHNLWLKERELRKQEIERAWRPIGKSPFNLSQKRKASDSLESLNELDVVDENHYVQTQETAKPALSPLLTSLLKSPSQAQNITSSSILHSAITSQRSVNAGSNPTIASLLNSSAGVNISAGIQQLVTTAITQESNATVAVATESFANGILEESIDTLPNIKVEDIESTILSSDDPLPEMKNEEVEVIISDLIQNADIVSDPEQHLQIDDNVDIITNLDNELRELCNEEKAAEEAAAKEKLEAEKLAEKAALKIDPFEFEEDPEICELSKPSNSLSKYQDNFEKDEDVDDEPVEEVEVKKETVDDTKSKDIPGTGSVEIVEVVVMEEAEIDKELNKTQIQDIVHSIRDSFSSTVSTENAEGVENEEEKVKHPTEEQIESVEDSVFDEKSNSMDLDMNAVAETGTAASLAIDTSETSRAETFTPEYDGSFFDDINIEVNKLDKSGKAKRDYSRTKKREPEKPFDILLAVEKAVNAQLEANDLADDNLSDEKDYRDEDKKFDISKSKIKMETDRSNSPWTEEDEMVIGRNKRRYSTSVTPIDSVPNSPASSSTYFDEDRDYRNWKKSVMLVYNRLATHKYASLFLKPITDDQAPGYHGIVYRPMDLQTIRKNIECGVIRNTLELQRDVLLMFSNAIMYNKTNELVYNMTIQMQQESVQQIQIFMQAQQGDVPQRRETRTSEPVKRKRPPEDNVRSKKRKED